MKPRAVVFPKLVPLALLLVGLAWSLEPIQLAGDEPKSGKAPLLATGTLLPEVTVDIGAQVPGKVVALGDDPDNPGKPINFRSRVKVGTVLAKIEPTKYEIEVEIARGELAQAEAEVKRAEAELALAALRAKRSKEPEIDALLGKVAEANLAKARGSQTRARAALKLAQSHLDYCTLKSPLDGVIIDLRVGPGQNVESSLNAPSLFLIATDFKRLKLLATVGERDIARVFAGQKVSFRVDAFPKDTFTGTVEQVRLNASQAKDGTVTYAVAIDTKNDDRKLIPYLTARVQFQEPGKQGRP
jgi:HlyD family secretion protein